MRRWLKWIGVALAVVLLVVLAVVVEFLRHGGQFKTLTAHFDGACTSIPLEASAEDIRIDRERGLAYLSYLDRRARVEGKEVTGSVMVLDLNSAEPHPRAALLADPPHFRPHGMSLYAPREGRRRLFVISHPAAAHEVVIFEETVTGEFAAIETIRDPLLARPNAIVATGPRQFYVGNDSGASSGFERFQEMALRRGMSALVYYDGSRMRTVDTNLKSAAGIATNADRTRLYVSETAGNRVRVYERDVVNGDVSLLETVPIGSAPDNLSVGDDGTVWIAAHARVSALIQHFRDASIPAPTQVFALRPDARGERKLREVYLDLGTQISAGSVAAPYEDSLLIGSITDPKILLCTLPGSAR